MRKRKRKKYGEFFLLLFFVVKKTSTLPSRAKLARELSFVLWFFRERAVSPLSLFPHSLSLVSYERGEEVRGVHVYALALRPLLGDCGRRVRGARGGHRGLVASGARPRGGRARQAVPSGRVRSSPLLRTGRHALDEVHPLSVSLHGTRALSNEERKTLSLSLSPKTDEKGARTSLIRLTRVSFWFGASLFLSLFSCLLCGFILDSLFLSLSQWEEMRERGVGGDLGREIAG